MPLKKYTAPVDLRVAKGLRLVVSLIDNFSGKRPVGNIRMLLKDQHTKMAQNPSGYYLFFKVPGDGVHIRTQSDYYFAVEREIKIPELDPGQPVETIRLQPKPCYPFPSRTTLIRGIVKDSQGNLLPGAIVSIEGTTIKTLTTAKGEFVCYYTGLGEEDVVVKNGKRYLIGGVEGAIPLRVSYNSLSGGVDLTDVAEGEVTVLKSPIILNKK
jgi:hypothetical protein